MPESRRDLLALTVKQPWADFVVDIDDPKDIENRTWRTNHRGLLLIHAAASSDRSVLDERSGERLTSALIGAVELIDVVRDSSSRWAERDQWHWILARPIRFAEPIPCRGALGLWKPDADTSARVLAQL